MKKKEEKKEERRKYDVYDNGFFFWFGKR